MEARLALAAHAVLEGSGLSVTAVCAQFGVSRGSYYTYKARLEAQGLEGLLPRSSRPGSSPNRTGVEMVETVCLKHDELLAEGWDAGARSVHDWLARAGVAGVPSARTIHKILLEHGRAARPGQAAPGLLPAVRGDGTERDVAAGRHPGHAGRRDQRGGAAVPGRPLPDGDGLTGRARRDRPRRVGVHGHGDEPVRQARGGAVRQRGGVHRPLPQWWGVHRLRGPPGPDRSVDEQLQPGPPADLREEGTRVADPGEVARRPTTRRRPGRPPDPAGDLRHPVQHPNGPTRPWTAPPRRNATTPPTRPSPTPTTSAAGSPCTTASSPTPAGSTCPGYGSASAAAGPA